MVRVQKTVTSRIQRYFTGVIREPAELRPLSVRRHGIQHGILALVLILLTSLVLSACGQPTPASQPMELPDEYEVADDFTHPNNAWARFDTDATAAYSLAGELYLEDRGQGVAAISPLVGKDYLDQTVSLNIRHVQGSVNNWMGVILRMQDEHNYYVTVISADGFLLVMEVVDGESTPLYGPEPSEFINQGKAENQLRVELEGNTINVWINDEVATVVETDSLAKAGETALFADAVPNGQTVVIAFDNFLLTSP